MILVLNPDIRFEALKTEIENVFMEAASFLGHSKMGLIVRGRTLSESEEKEILNIISQKTELTIICVVDEQAEAEKLFASALNHDSDTSYADDDLVDASDAIQDYEGHAKIFRGNLRSGQDISCEQSIVIMGDVKPGASVTSYGSIFILGELRGNAFAGAGGDRNAIVMALELNPLQVRIADAIAISPDAEKGPKLKFKKKRIMAGEDKPEVAYIENGHIIKTYYGASFLRQYNKN